jgi:anti-sigma factor RsiW
MNMNCEIAHERIVTAAYGELPDEQTHELQRHLTGCPECAAEREQLLALKLLADAYPVLEPAPNMVARARLRLDEALDALPPMRWYQRLSQKLMNNVASLQAAPVAAALLLIAGAGAGSLGGFEFAQRNAAHSAALPNSQAQPAAVTASAAKPGAEAVSAESTVAPAEIATISSIVRQPNSNMVEVRYNQTVPRQVKGSLDDPAIRQLLMLASENATSPGVRDDSVGLLASECRSGHSCRATGIRDALLVALRYDRNAGVRAKALQGLEPYVSEDVQVRNAVLESLMNDADPRIRTAAINLLAPVEGDTSVREVLHSVANTDQNPYIRTVSRQVLSRVPEIQ